MIGSLINELIFVLRIAQPVIINFGIAQTLQLLTRCARRSRVSGVEKSQVVFGPADDRKLYPANQVRQIPISFQVANMDFIPVRAARFQAVREELTIAAEGGG